MARPDRTLRDSVKQYGEKAPETADTYFAYGKALLENAITQSGVLGKADPDDSFDEDNGVFCMPILLETTLITNAGDPLKMLAKVERSYPSQETGMTKLLTCSLKLKR